MWAAYPRASGSPPHAWGQPNEEAIAEDQVRFTPTCVGTTVAHRLEVIGIAVHPHMRGDNATSSPPNKSRAGSPPHAWGQHDPNNPLHREYRFTPTCVGTTLQVALCMPMPSVHPHMRGDD